MSHVRSLQVLIVLALVSIQSVPTLAKDASKSDPLSVAQNQMAQKDYSGARKTLEKLVQAANTSKSVRGEAVLTIGHTFWREGRFVEAAQVFQDAARREDLMKLQRWEAADRAKAMQRLTQGLPARDPMASRTQLPKPPTPSIVLHVTTIGKASNSGTESQPLGSLSQAFQRIRQLRRKGKINTGGVTVLVHGGEYHVTETVKLTKEDSGTLNAPVVFRASPGEKPVFTGGIRLQGFTQVTAPKILNRLPKEARGKVVEVDLAKLGIGQLPPMGRRGFGSKGINAAPWVELYVNGKPQTLARWPNDSFVKIGKVHRTNPKQLKQQPSGAAGIFFEYQDPRPSRWTEAEDAWLFGYWGYLWAIDSRNIKQIDSVQKRIEMEPSFGYNYKQGHPYFAFNLLEEIDTPGEWYLNRKTKTLYFYPPENFDESTARLSTLATPFFTTKETSHLRIQGLMFELACGLGASINGGEAVRLVDCTFQRLGNWGIAINGGKHHGVLSCDIAILGGGGISLHGGNKSKLIPAGHFVENCHIHDFTRIDRSYAPSVHIDGVGNRVVHNLIHDSPHHGICMGGYDHLVELNEVRDVVQESDDQSGIDMWGNPALRGNVIRYNFWHHNGGDHLPCGQAGIRLDDMISAVTMYGNIFWDTARGHFGGIQINGGKDNLVVNNLFVDCTAALSFSPWGKNRWLSKLYNSRFRKNMFAEGVKPTEPPHITKYPDLAELKERIDHNYLWRNVTFECPQFTLRDKGQNEMLGNVELTKNPGFTDADKGNFALPNDSTLYDRLGFRPIPFDEIGLYVDEHRPTLPPEAEAGRSRH